MKNHLHQASGKILQRGLNPTPRHRLAGAMPFRATATPPASYFIFPQKMSMWLNDQFGDCVTAEEAFNKACHGIFIEDATVQTWASSNGDLNGADLEPVIQQMQSAGFSQDSNVYGDGSPLSINYADAPTLQAAIYQAGTLGGSIKIGIAADQLPSGAGNNNGWFLPSDSPDTNEDHCVSLCGFGTAQDFVTAMNTAFPGLNLTLPSGVDATMQGYALYTWSTIGFVATQAMINMTGEAWLRNPSTVSTGTGTPTSNTVYTTDVTPPTPPTPTVITVSVASDLAAGNYLLVTGAQSTDPYTITVPDALIAGSYLVIKQNPTPPVSA